jgi:hypothetical protein
MSFGALAAGTARFSPDAGAAKGSSIKAMHDTRPDMKTTGDLDPCCMTLRLSG